MKTLALGLTLLASACFAPVANAAVADSLLPFYDAADGVRVVQRSTGEAVMRFDRKAAKLYRSLAGKRAHVGCGTVTPEDLDGPFSTTGFTWNPDARLPKKRGSVRMWTGDERTELCVISTRKAKNERVCLPPDASSKLCVRVAVATKPSGAAFLDARARTIELAFAWTMVGAALMPEFKVPGDTTLEKVRNLLGPDVVELATPDDSPPAGKLGYWTQAENYAIVVLLADGTRRFMRFHDGVFSTNDLELTGFDSDDVFTLT